MKTILDIGSNNLAGFKHLNTIESIQDEDVKIFVEANPECWNDLEKEIQYIKNAFLVKKGLDIKIRKTVLMTRDDVNKCIGATIMGEQFINDSLHRWGIKVDKFKHYDIDTTTIFDLIKEFNIVTDKCILKLDAEGVEYSVLKQILDNNISFAKIYCEFHVHNEKDALKKQYLLDNFKLKKQQIIEWH